MTLSGHIALVNSLINIQTCTHLTIPFLALSVYLNRQTLPNIFQLNIRDNIFLVFFYTLNHRF